MARGAGTLIGSAPGEASPPAAANGLRPLARRRPVPNGRAALGALLVAVATVVLFSVATDGGGTALDDAIVAKRAIPIGSRLRADDLAVARVRLGAGTLRQRAFGTVASLLGAVTIAPIGAGELVQASAVIAGGSGASLRQVSVPIDAARAFGNSLRDGEQVDVLATFGTGMSPLSDRLEPRGPCAGQAEDDEPVAHRTGRGGR